MRFPHNLEKHPQYPRTYIAYDADGCAFRIESRAVSGCTGWQATPSHAGRDTDPRAFNALKLADLAAKVGASKRAEG